MGILKSLKEEMPAVQDARDMNFFVTAMDMASRQYCNRQAGEAVNELLLTGDNYKFIGDNNKVSTSYNCQRAPIGPAFFFNFSA